MWSHLFWLQIQKSMMRSTRYSVRLTVRKYSRISLVPSFNISNGQSLLIAMVLCLSLVTRILLLIIRSIKEEVTNLLIRLVPFQSLLRCLLRPLLKQIHLEYSEGKTMNCQLVCTLQYKIKIFKILDMYTLAYYFDWQIIIMI